MNLIEIIAEEDEMWAGDRDHYFRVGRSAMECISAALRLAGRESCSAILDLPCGHGRVLRHLRAAFPSAQITACDINQSGLAFCAETFGATVVPSSKRIQEVSLPGRFELIWCGSLLTHLEERCWAHFLSFFFEHLLDDGVLLFTTHGRLSAKWIRERTHTYGLDAQELPSLLAAYDAEGFGYAPYPGSPDYGISLSAPSWVLQQIQRYPHLRVLLVNEAGWDGHQDVYACSRVKNALIDSR